MGVNVSSMLKGGSDCVYDYCCDLCEGEGQQKEAVGYCSDCHEYLCTECFRHHTRPKPMRNHVLLDQQQMPKRQQHTGTDSLSSTLNCGSDFVYDYCCDLCEGEGQQKEAVGYCSDCREYLCTDCFSHHIKSKPSCHHSLLDQQHMPTRKKTHAHHVMDIHVGSRDGRDRPGITGCVVLPGDKLVLVPWNNCNVKLVDLTRGDVVSRLKLSGRIWGITQVSSTQVAVTSHREQTIYFVNVGDKLKLDRKVKVKGQCRGIARINDNLVVSYLEPVKVEIISMEGEVLQAVVTEDKGKQVFTSLEYIAVSKDYQMVYISDGDTVISVDLAGRVRAMYNGNLRQPLGLTVDTAGTVYVCSCMSHKVLQLTADLTLERELFQRSDDVWLPASICYCEATDRLYVGMVSYVVKVFQMT